MENVCPPSSPKNSDRLLSFRWIRADEYDADDLRTLDKQQRDAYLRRIPATYPEEDFEARVMLYHLYVLVSTGSDCDCWYFRC
jgi:hypothetical protein